MIFIHHYPHRMRPSFPTASHTTCMFVRSGDGSLEERGYWKATPKGSDTGDIWGLKVRLREKEEEEKERKRARQRQTDRQTDPHYHHHHHHQPPAFNMWLYFAFTTRGTYHDGRLDCLWTLWQSVALQWYVGGVSSSLEAAIKCNRKETAFSTPTYDASLWNFYTT